MTSIAPIPNNSAHDALTARRGPSTPAECEAILARQNLPHAVIRHSRKVAEIAVHLAAALAASGLAIDTELVRAAALLHDLAKGQPRHAETGAAILHALGMTRVAAIVAAHTEMDFTGVLDERAIVHLADKLTDGDQLVTLNERFQPALIKFRGNPGALNAARRRKAIAQRIAGAIETRLGKPLFAILAASPQSPARNRPILVATEAQP
jgi:molybdenum cofactor cytidylyltransferase